jgi:hypothetical protein
MPLGDSHPHHHGLLAGLGAGTAAVLVCGLLVMGVWHRVSGAVAAAVLVLVWALMAAVLAAAIYAVTFLFLRLRHHVIHPETLTRHAIRAEVIPPPLSATETPAIPARVPVAEMLPVARYHSGSAGTVQAALPAATDPARIYLTDNQIAALMRHRAGEDKAPGMREKDDDDG